MGFGQAISTCLSKYADFHGRAARPEYWWFALFNALASVVASIVDKGVIGYPALQVIVALALMSRPSPSPSGGCTTRIAPACGC